MALWLLSIQLVTSNSTIVRIVFSTTGNQFANTIDNWSVNVALLCPFQCMSYALIRFSALVLHCHYQFFS